MDIKSYCPYCGAHTVVQITQEETVSFYGRKKSKLPEDFSERAICPCCIDDGKVQVVGEQYNLHFNLMRA